MVTQKELKESNGNDISMRKKMACPKMVCKSPNLDHQPPQKPTKNTPKNHPTTHTKTIGLPPRYNEHYQPIPISYDHRVP